MEKKTETSEDNLPANYKPSLSTGVYGSYSIKQLSPEYKPSYSTGVYGSYIINNSINSNTITNTPITIKTYTYFPSISNGIFGTWLYNDSSPSTQISPTQTTTKPKSKKPWKTSSGYSSWFRKRESIDYKFEIRGPRNGSIENGKKYNVKLLQEYKLPFGKNLANMLKKSKQKPPKGKVGTLFICEGSVVSFSGECIINAANEGMLGGGGVDGAISSAGGDALYHLRQLEPLVKGSKHVRCKTGDSKITQSGYPYNKLKCDWVIHAVGPNYGIMYRGGKNMKIKDIDNLLYLSYAKSMLLCKEKGIKSVGFCLISSGIFRGPKSLDDVLKIGIEAIRDYMFDGIEVFMIGYQNNELVCLSKMAPKVLGKMHKEYAKVKERKGWGMGWNMGWKRGNSNDSNESGKFSWPSWNKKKTNSKGNKGNKSNKSVGEKGEKGEKKKNDP